MYYKSYYKFVETLFYRNVNLIINDWNKNDKLSFFIGNKSDLRMRLRQENFISRKSYKSSSQLPLPVYWLRSVMHSRSRFSKYGFTVDERRRMYFNFSQFYLSLSFVFLWFIFFSFSVIRCSARFPIFSRTYARHSCDFSHRNVREREREYNLIRSKNGMIEFFKKIWTEWFYSRSNCG